MEGPSVWIHGLDVRPVESVRDALESGLRGSDVLVTLVDRDYPAKPDLFFELGAAIEIALNKRRKNCPTHCWPLNGPVFFRGF